MRWTEGGRADLHIRQIGVPRQHSTGDSKGKYEWKIKWDLRLLHRPGLGSTHEATFTEPFAHAKYEKVAEYLDTALEQTPFNHQSARKMSDKIDKYRKALFTALGLTDKDLRLLSRKELYIHITPDPDVPPAKRTIHSIEWEQLEDRSLWTAPTPPSDPPPSAITVCRYVPMKANKGGRSYEATSTIDILLVVARPNIHMGPGELPGPSDAFNPGTIRHILVELQEMLKSKGSSHTIRLEVVRPGTLDELRRHLTDRKRRITPHKPYDIVHIDVHGVIRETDKMPTLRFNECRTNDKIGSTLVEGSELARLLQNFGVESVVLNSCKSAVAHHGPISNLSHVLLRHGVSTVVAMTHTLHDSASRIFFHRFYHELLLSGDTVSVAASKARHILSRKRKRFHPKDRTVRMQDWFIPVVYTSRDAAIRFFNRDVWSSRATSRLLFGIKHIIFVVGCGIFYFMNYHRDDVDRRQLQHTLAQHIASEEPRLVSSGIIASATLFWILSGLFIQTWHVWHVWRVRQWLRVLQPDLQNGLRLESDLKQNGWTLFHCPKDFEKRARPLLHSLVAIWKCTHFVSHKRSLDARWFVHPSALEFRDDLGLWLRTLLSLLCLKVHLIRCQRHMRRGDGASLFIIENVDELYPEPKQNPSKMDTRQESLYLDGRRRLEDWMEQNLATTSEDDPEYLIVTDLRGKQKAAGWLESLRRQKNVPALQVPVNTVYTPDPENLRKKRNHNLSVEKRHERLLAWICADACQPPKRQEWALLWETPRVVRDGIAFCATSSTKFFKR